MVFLNQELKPGALNIVLDPLVKDAIFQHHLVPVLQKQLGSVRQLLSPLLMGTFWSASKAVSTGPMTWSWTCISRKVSGLYCGRLLMTPTVVVTDDTRAWDLVIGSLAKFLHRTNGTVVPPSDSARKSLTWSESFVEMSGTVSVSGFNSCDMVNPLATSLSPSLRSCSLGPILESPSALPLWMLGCTWLWSWRMPCQRPIFAQ